MQLFHEFVLDFNSNGMFGFVQRLCLHLFFFFFSLLHSVSVCDCNESVRFHAPRCIRNGKPNGARRLNERVLDVGVVGNRNHNAFT